MPSFLYNYSAINRDTEREGGSLGEGRLIVIMIILMVKMMMMVKEERRGREKWRKRVRWYTNPQPQKRQRK